MSSHLTISEWGTYPTLLAFYSVILGSLAFLFQTHFLRACEHCLMRKPFIQNESGEEKSKTSSFTGDHIGYTFRIIQVEAKLSCSETTLFSQVTAGLSSTVYPFLAVFICPGVPTSWPCTGELEAKRCLFPDFLWCSPVRKGPAGRATMPSW